MEITDSEAVVHGIRYHAPKEDSCGPTAEVFQLVLFYVSKNMMTQDVAWSHGKDGGYLMLGNMCYTYVVITVCLKAGIEIRAWTWPVHLAIWGSICCWFLFLIVYSKTWEKQWIPEGAGMTGMVGCISSHIYVIPGMLESGLVDAASLPRLRWFSPQNSFGWAAWWLRPQRCCWTYPSPRE